MSDANLLSRVAAARGKFSKGQRRIADYVTENYAKAAYMTAAALGEVAWVSESTVVRFATTLGYSGYPQMQRALQDLVHTRLTTVERIEMMRDRMEGQDVLRAVMETDIDKIRSALYGLDQAVFDQAIDMIAGARIIYILGLRSSSFLAGFLGFYFKLMFPNVSIVGGSENAGDIFENLYRIGSEDVIIGITFPRYSTRTLKGLHFAKSRGAGVIAITDCETSPIAGMGDCTLYAPSEMVSFVDSLVAPLSLLNALIVSIGMRKRDEVIKTFAELEDIWEEYQTYQRFDDSDELADGPDDDDDDK